MSPTGRNPTSPRLQYTLLRTELAKKIQEDYRDMMPKLEPDYSSLELRLMAELFPSSRAHTGQQGTDSPRGSCTDS